MLTQKMFIGRESELDFLEEKYKSENFECILVYGRRRIGKTELIKKFVQNKEHIYHLVSREEGKIQLRKLTSSAHKFFGGIKPEINQWEDFFEYFTDKVNENTILIIDEFPYLMEESDSIPSYFQEFIDQYLKGKNVILILAGSSIGMMEEAMSYKNPLYGRRTGQIDLKPFKFRESIKMIENRDFKDQIRFFSVFGGVPFYLEKIYPDKTLEGNIYNKIFRETEVLHEEPNLLLREEMRKPNRYSSILESIASGKTTPKRISDDTGIPQQSVPKYLNKLEKIRLIEHEKPVTERNKRSRKGIYQLRDNLFDFWYTFVFPNLSDVRENPEKAVGSFVMPDLKEFVGKKFEKICKESVRISEGLNYPKLGRWWYKDKEVDLVGLNESENEILFGECKWRNKKVSKKVLRSLEEKTNSVNWRENQREEKYILFSKSGFTKSLRNLEKEREDLKLFSLTVLEKIFKK